MYPLFVFVIYNFSVPYLCNRKASLSLLNVADSLSSRGVAFKFHVWHYYACVRLQKIYVNQS